MDRFSKCFPRKMTANFVYSCGGSAARHLKFPKFQLIGHQPEGASRSANKLPVSCKANLQKQFLRLKFKQINVKLVQ